MAEQDKEKNADELLDSLLAAYSEAQPRPGFETRLLSQLRGATAEANRRRGMFRWLWATSAIGAVAVALLLIQLLPVTDLPRPPIIPIAGVPVLPATTRPKEIRPRVKAPQTAALEPPAETSAVRQEVFPTPSRLSPQEELLLRYLARTPRDEVAAQSHLDEPPPEAPEPLVPQTRQFSGTELHTTQ
jgi:hypothetical protein